jgi:hypothetical protein
LPDYLPWTEIELGNVERALKRYRTLGLEASTDIGRSGQGVVTLSQVDTKVPDAAIIIFEIHKLKRTDTDLRAHWVVQIQSVGGRNQELVKHGCVSAGSAVFALAKAEKDAQDGFVAKDSFDMAANAYWLKL